VSIRHVALVDVDLDIVVDTGIDPDREKDVWRRAFESIGRDAHQPVHARFGLQPAIGVVALDQHGRGLDAGLFAVVHFQHFDLEARRSAQRVYMRNSMLAQSWLSVPPAPAWISR
jgi:hypothetical protein